MRSIRADLAGHESDFDALLTLRARIDPLRDDLQTLVLRLDKRSDALKAQLNELGGAPAPNEPGPPDLQKKREALTARASAVAATDREAHAALRSADTLWARLASLRRDAFAGRLLQSGASPLRPDFWLRLFRDGVPGLLARTATLWAQETEQVQANGGLHLLAALALLLAMFGLVLAVTRRWLARRAERQAPPRLAKFQRGAALRHAGLVVLQRSLPLPFVLGLFYLAELYFDFASDDLDALLVRITIAALLIGLSRGLSEALLAPRESSWRLVECSDRLAATITEAVVLATRVFVVGIVLTSFEDVISAPPSVVAFTSLLVAVGTIFAYGRALFQLRRRLARRAASSDVAPSTETHPAEAPVVPVSETRLALNLAWTHPLLVLILTAGVVALLLGYVNLAGFLMSRLTIVLLVCAAAVLISLAVDEIFGQLLTSVTPTGRAAARIIGLPYGLLDLISTTLAGLLRLCVVFIALLFAFGPWGVRFGDLNPFNDALLTFGVSYLRVSIGAAAYALLELVVGLIVTRIVVGWLERRLLPLTTLDPGVRNSMTTIAGYLGIAGTIIFVLSQLGVDPQKLAVIAGALSVGIGFGLQAITSNFISGLIVLAERPIRVGDVISVKGEEGRVKKISVRSTLIGGFDSTDIIVPNTDILTAIVRNRSLSDRQARLKLSLLVDHGSDPDEVERLFRESVACHQRIITDPAPAVFFLRATEIGLEFELRCAVDDLDDVDRVRSDLHFQILRRFRKAGIRLASLRGSTDAIVPQKRENAAGAGLN